MRKRYILLLFLLYILNLADMALTFYGLSLGAKELNPLFTKQTVLVKIWLPLGLAIICFFTVHYARKEKIKWVENTVKIVVAFLVGFYLLIVLWNLGVIFSISFQ